MSVPVLLLMRREEEIKELRISVSYLFVRKFKIIIDETLVRW